MARLSKQQEQQEHQTLEDAAYFLAMSDQTKKIMEELKQNKDSQLTTGTACGPEGNTLFFKQTVDAQEGGENNGEDEEERKGEFKNTGGAAFEGDEGTPQIIV